MAKLNFDNKEDNGGANANGKLTAIELKSIAASINAIYDALFTNGEIPSIPVIKTSVLPESTLSPDQFQELPDGHIGLIGFENIGTGGGDPKLSTPALSFGTSTTSQNVINWGPVTNATSYQLQYNNSGTWTTIYTGSLLTYTHSGLASGTPYQYRLKATASGYQDSNYGTGIKSTEVEGGYVVERRFSIDLQGEFGSTVTEPGITWNTWKATNAQLGINGGAVLSNLVTEANSASTVGITNINAWNGSTGGSASATGSNPPYPLVAINGGFQFSSDAGLKLTGLNPSKYYQFYILAADSEANAALTITIGSNTQSVTSSLNYPADGSNRYTNSAVTKIFNSRPNSSGEIIVNVHKTGAYYQATIALVVIEEANSAKP